MVSQGGSLRGIVLGDDTAVVLYIRLYHKSVMVLGSQVIWNMDLITGPVQVVHGWYA